MPRNYINLSPSQGIKMPRGIKFFQRKIRSICYVLYFSRCQQTLHAVTAHAARSSPELSNQSKLVRMPSTTVPLRSAIECALLQQLDERVAAEFLLDGVRTDVLGIGRVAAADPVVLLEQHRGELFLLAKILLCF